MKKYLFAITAFLAAITVNAQTEWSYQAIPATYLTGYAVTAADTVAALATETDWHDLTADLPAGYVTNGTVDYTQYIRKGMNLHLHVKFPNFPILINADSVTLSGTDTVGCGIRPRSNTKMYFPINSKIILKKNNYKDYYIFGLYNVSNVIFYFPNIIGDRNIHSSSTGGEKGVGIKVRSGRNIKIIKGRISNCWGDGIVLSGINSGSLYYVKNVLIDHTILDNNRRNGLTVASVDTLTINGIICSNTNGTSPQVGIDFEPDVNGQELKNITINNPVTFNNYSFGLKFPLFHLRQGALQKNLSITIKNHINVQRPSIRHIEMVLSSTSDTQYPPFTGYIKFNNPRWYRLNSSALSSSIYISDLAGDNQAIVSFNWGCTVFNDCTFAENVHTEFVNKFSPGLIPTWITSKCGSANTNTIYTGSNVTHQDCFTLTPIETGGLSFMKSTNTFSSISVYPNPATNDIKIQLDKSVEKFTIKLTSIDGKVAVIQQGSGNYATVDISKLTAGMYFVEVTDGMNKSTQKLIKEQFQLYN